MPASGIREIQPQLHKSDQFGMWHHAERQIRKQVEEQLQTDLSNRKQIVRDEVQISCSLFMLCVPLTSLNTHRKFLGAQSVRESRWKNSWRAKSQRRRGMLQQMHLLSRLMQAGALAAWA